LEFFVPVSVAVTTLREGVSDNKRFVDVSLALTSTYDATQAADGFLIPMDKVSIREVTDVHTLPPVGDAAGAAVQLAGTKGAPRLKLRTFTVTTGAAANPVDTDVPPAAVRVRLFGA